MEPEPNNDIPSISTTRWHTHTYMFYAMLAGCFGGLSGVVGKLSVGDDFTLGFLLRAVLFSLNGVFTAQMWRYFLKALSRGPTPVCHIVNTGVNFVVSAVCGVIIFQETISFMWMCGAVLVAIGLTIIATDTPSDQH
eukprot:Tbor_TRINITY_DN5067_c1_g1::TRINITY_DN5067_c1_g1_i1::g.14229::m.14229